MTWLAISSRVLTFRIIFSNSRRGLLFSFIFLQGPRDLKNAFILYKEAAEQRNVMAISRLARCYFHGIGTEKNSNMVDQLCKTMLQEIMKRRYK
jgi:hypothetical protein